MSRRPSIPSAARAYLAAIGRKGGKVRSALMIAKGLKKS
jgi:hypothetical protein